MPVRKNVISVVAAAAVFIALAAAAASLDALETKHHGSGRNAAITEPVTHSLGVAPAAFRV